MNLPKIFLLGCFISSLGYGAQNSIQAGSYKGAWILHVIGVREHLITKDNFSQEGDVWFLSQGEKKFRAGEFIYPSFEELKQNFQSLSVIESDSTFTVATKVNVFDLVRNPASADAVIQVASQFNALESRDKYRSTVASYIDDRTQGPYAVIPTLAGTLYRNIFYPESAEFNALRDTPIADKVDHGYLSWGSNPGEIMGLMGEGDEEWDKMLIPHMKGVGVEGSNYTIDQVFCSSAPTNTYRNSGDLKTQYEIAEKLLRRQYLGLGYYAALKAAETGKRVQVHLTHVGSGAFENPSDLIENILREFRATFQKSNLDVTFHDFSGNNLSMFLGSRSNLEMIFTIPMTQKLPISQTILFYPHSWELQLLLA